MVGAGDVAFLREGALDAMGGKIAHPAPNWPVDAKAIARLLAACSAAGEAMALAQKLGVDMDQILDIVGGSAASSWMLRDRGPRCWRTTWCAGAVDIFVKDIIVLETGAATTPGRCSPPPRGKIQDIGRRARRPPACNRVMKAF